MLPILVLFRVHWQSVELWFRKCPQFATEPLQCNHFLCAYFRREQRELAYVPQALWSTKGEIYKKSHLKSSRPPMILNEGCPISNLWTKPWELPRRVGLFLSSEEVRGEKTSLYREGLKDRQFLQVTNWPRSVQ